VEWERLLAMPLAEVRAQLGNVAPTRYEALRDVVRFAPVPA
jgi:hypothetical protein